MPGKSGPLDLFVKAADVERVRRMPHGEQSRFMLQQLATLVRDLAEVKRAVSVQIDELAAAGDLTPREARVLVFLRAFYGQLPS